MNTNSHYIIGKNHSDCQDYALDGMRQIISSDLYYAIVCDGCSSSPRSDFGSRILAQTCFFNIHKFGSEEFWQSSIHDANSIVKYLGLPKECLDATVNIAAVLNNKLTIQCWGDGAISILFKEGTREDYIIRYPSGAPNYLNYQADPERFCQFKETFGTKKVVTHFSNSVESEDISFIAPYYFSLQVPIDNIASVFVMTDGVESFKKTESTDTYISSNPLDVRQVIDELTSVKAYNGNFMLRRMRGMKKKNPAWFHEDDLAVAAIHIGKS